MLKWVSLNYTELAFWTACTAAPVAVATRPAVGASPAAGASPPASASPAAGASPAAATATHVAVVAGYSYTQRQHVVCLVVL